MIQFLLVLAGVVAVYSVVVAALVLKYRRENRSVGLTLVASVHPLRPVALPPVEVDQEQLFARPRLALVK